MWSKPRPVALPSLAAPANDAGRKRNDESTLTIQPIWLELIWPLGNHTFDQVGPV